MHKYWGLFLACMLLSSCGEDKKTTDVDQLLVEVPKVVVQEYKKIRI